MSDSPHGFVNRRDAVAALLASIAGPSGLAVAAAPQASTAAKAADTPVRALAERYFDALMDLHPLDASALGLATPAQAAHLPIEIATAHRQQVEALSRRTLASLARFNRERLDESERITIDVLEHHARDALDELRFPAHLLPLHHMPGMTLFSMANASANALSPFESVAHHEQHLSRLRQVPAWCAQASANLREGVQRGIVLPSAIIERMLPMLRSLADAAVDKSPFAEPLQRLPAAASAVQRQRLEGAYREVIARRVVPSIARLVQVVERDYRPHGLPSAGLHALPDGKAWYAQRVRSNTTTRLGPAEIHALGLAEVQRLRAEMGKLQAHYGFKGTLEEFLLWHDRRPQARPYRSEGEIIEAYNELNRRIVPQLRTLFRRVPKAPLEIHPEPELTRHTASDHYRPPAPDGSRPGVFYAVITDPAIYTTPRMTSLFLHEGQPGHHYQNGIAQEAPLTRLQRFWFYSAYGEGWALYAETLGHEMGLYADPNAYMGHLGMAMLRAVRLVVDTGLHDQGWTRERAIDYLIANTGYPERDARVQIERYMVSPGQALSYAIGRMKIEQLRDRARAALGDRFSIAAFHDEVLNSGAMPLAVLEAKIDRWIARAKQP